MDRKTKKQTLENRFLGRAGLKPRKGFTTIEVIVVLVLLGILAVVAAAAFSDPSTLVSGADAEAIKTHLRYAQINSQNSDEVWGINFSGSTYWLFSGGSTGNKELLPNEESTDVLLPVGVTINQTVAFSADLGQPSDSASGSPPRGSDLTLTLGDETITIYRDTGYIP